MPKCPYCFEELVGQPEQCPHCSQFIIDKLVNVDYKGVDKKHCIFCGKFIFTEAKICKFCHRWLDELESDSENASE